MECYRVRVPDGHRLTGHTAKGRRVPIMPGEYLVHRFVPKVPPWREKGLAALRFVGADGAGNDVHLGVPFNASIADALSIEVRQTETP